MNLDNINNKFDTLPKTGDKINEYKIIKLIGQGGMAYIYEAIQPSLSRKVALKILNPKYSLNQDFIDQFKKEASAAANLCHPNIVSIHDFGEHKGLLYYVMDRINGQSLEDIIQYRRKHYLKSKRTFTQYEAVNILKQIASGLVYAHEKGIAHRDIKPNNILIEDKTNRALITDFGLASWEEKRENNLLFGTPLYMSPEQIKVQPGNTKSDIYALGVVFYEMMTGKLPFEASPLKELIEKIKKYSISPPSEHNPRIDPQINNLILKMISKDPEVRIQNLKQLVFILNKLQKQPLQIHKSKNFKKVKRFFTLFTIIILMVFIIILILKYNQVSQNKEWASKQLQLYRNYKRMVMHKEALKIYESILSKYPMILSRDNIFE